MQIVQRQYDLPSIQPRPLLTKLLFFSQVEEQLPSNHEVHNEVQSGRRLECVMQLHYEWASHVLQYLPFGTGMDLLIALIDHFLLDDFHGV